MLNRPQRLKEYVVGGVGGSGRLAKLGDKTAMFFGWIKLRQLESGIPVWLSMA